MQYCYPVGQLEKSSNIYETSVQGSNGGSLDRWNAPYYPAAPEQTRPDAVPSSLAPGTLNHYSSRSSISSSDSHLFSPKQGSGPPLYSPATPPHVSVAYRVKTEMDHPNNPSTSIASQKVKSGAKHQTIEMAPSVPMQPGFISQLATYMADMVVYLWYSEPKQRKAPVFPKPTALFAGFCHDVLMTSGCLPHAVTSSYANSLFVQPKSLKASLSWLFSLSGSYSESMPSPLCLDPSSRSPL